MESNNLNYPALMERLHLKVMSHEKGWSALGGLFFGVLMGLILGLFIGMKMGEQAGRTPKPPPVEESPNPPM